MARCLHIAELDIFSCFFILDCSPAFFEKSVEGFSNSRLARVVEWNEQRKSNWIQKRDKFFVRYYPANFPSCCIYQLSATVDSDGAFPIVTNICKHMVLVVVVDQKVVNSVIDNDDVWALVQDICYDLQLFKRENFPGRIRWRVD